MEKEFQEWYSKWSKLTNIDPNPDHWRHLYDYRSAFKAGIEPKWNENDEKYHWDSKFKDDLHPNRYIFENNKWLDTKNNKYVNFEEVLVAEEKTTEYMLNKILNGDWE
jgi:hypothetical protein